MMVGFQKPFEEVWPKFLLRVRYRAIAATPPEDL
jgi:hypothetical protein